jgi:ParB family chromosome partitioning protein
MGKLDRLMEAAGAIAAESMGAGRERAVMHGASPPPARPSWSDGIQRSKAGEIPLDKIVADPNQPRAEFDPKSLQDLAESLNRRGQVQPIRVRWDEAAGNYVIICGERRWRAAALAGRPTVSAIIMDGPIRPEELLAMQLVENCFRENLRGIDQARAMRTLIETYGWSTHECAAELAIDQSSVVRTLKLLELPEPVQEMVQAGEITPATGYELTKVDDPEEARELAEEVRTRKLSRDATAQRVRQKGKGRGARKAKGKLRLPVEMKHRSASGVRLVAHTAARHTPEDVLAALEEFASAIRERIDRESRDAA